MNEWINMPNDRVISEYYGYTYKITNLTNNYFYIGKKVFSFKRTRPPLKGRKNKRHYLVPSDYLTYYGSSKELLSDIERLGKENFKREVIKLCKTPWELSYEELITQIEYKVIFREDSYNGILNVRLKKCKNRDILKQKKIKK